MLCRVQWAYWDGVRAYEAKNRAYLQSQVRAAVPAWPRDDWGQMVHMRG